MKTNRLLFNPRKSMKNNLNLEKIQKELETAVFEAVDEIMDIAKIRLEEKTPEDKMDLVH